MVQTRLETVAPNLLHHLRQCDTPLQRKAALTAAEFAISCTQLREPPIADVLAALREGSRVTLTSTEELGQLIEQLDARYFALHEAAETARGGDQDWLPVFRQARSASAVLFATSESAWEAAVEAVYEASAAVDDPSELFRIVMSIR